MRTIFSVILLLQFIGISALGQNRFTIEFSGTKPFIPDILNTYNFSTIPFSSLGDLNITGKYDLNESYKTKPGFSLNFGIERNIKTRFNFNAGIGFAFHNFERATHLDLDVEMDSNISIGEDFITGVPIGFIFGNQADDSIRFPELNPNSNDRTVIGNPNAGMTRIFYLAIPLKIHYSIVPNRFNIGIGVSNYFIAFSSQLKSMLDLQSQPYTLKEYKDKSSDGLNNYQLNGIASLEYRIFQSIWIQTGYNHGFLSIYDKPQPDSFPGIDPEKTAKYRTIEVGLKYVF